MAVNIKFDSCKLEVIFAIVMDSGDEDISRDFAKLSRQSFNSGYREGISDGKDSIMQKGFDFGYSHGFKIGMAAGYYKGFLETIKNDLSNSSSEQCKESIKSAESDVLLNDTSKESCVVCKDSNLVNVDYKIVEENQIKKNLEIIQNLRTKYSAVTNEYSVNDLEVLDKFKITDCTKSLINEDIFQTSNNDKAKSCDGQSCSRCCD